MTNAALLSTPAMSLPPITYKDQPVVTTEMLAQAYGCSAKNIRDNFNNNRDRFVEGKHFYSLQNGELQAFRDCTESFGAVVPARTRNLTIWPERGAARHAKMLNTDRAWDVFEMLEETFFRVVKPEAEPLLLTSPDSPITPDQQKTLQDIVRAKVDTIPDSDRHGGLYPQIWTRFKNHFHIPRYTELPQSRMSEAVAYLMHMDIRPKALPAPEPEPAPEPTPQDRMAAEGIDRLRRLCREFSDASDAMLALSARTELMWSLKLIANLSNYALLDHYQGITAKS